MTTNNTTTAGYDILLTATIGMIGERQGVEATREALKRLAVPGLVDWFDETYGRPVRRVCHSTLSNGVVVSEEVS